jgi:hypothetical protein
MERKVAIVGGGLCGLFLAYRISASGTTSVVLFESSYRLGGRIWTVNVQGSELEAGAGRIATTHRRVLSLVKELGLSDALTKPVENETPIYIKDGIEVRAPTLPPGLDRDLRDLDTKSMFEILNEQMSSKEVGDLVSSMGYDSEFGLCSARDALNSFKDLSSARFQQLQGGLSRITDTLVDRLKTRKNVSIFMRHHIDDLQDLLQNYARVILCVPVDSMRMLLPPSRMNIIGDSIARIYAKFSSPIWFKGLRRISTNNRLRMFMPIDDEVALVSYSTNANADTWQKAQTMGTLQSDLMTLLRKTFPDREIPEPIWIQLFYWPIGAHSWTPTTSSEPRGRSSVIHNRRILVSGEAMSMQHHGWMEGALESAHVTLTSLGIFL